MITRSPSIKRRYHLSKVGKHLMNNCFIQSDSDVLVVLEVEVAWFGFDYKYRLKKGAKINTL